MIGTFIYKQISVTREFLLILKYLDVNKYQ